MVETRPHSMPRDYATIPPMSSSHVAFIIVRSYSGACDPYSAFKPIPKFNFDPV